MTTAKPILYGVSDFVLMRTKGAYYIDRLKEVIAEKGCTVQSSFQKR